MRRLAFVMAGVTYAATIALLVTVTWFYRDYPGLVGLTWIASGAALLGCLLIVVIGVSRRYELNPLLVPIAAIVGVTALIAFSWLLILLALLLAATIIASGLAMEQHWRTTPTG